jgi:hypothetical protein
MKIYIITHKKFEKITDSDLYQPLLVGADFNKGEKDYLRDNDFSGNISSKNKNYCELTGLYWIWKRSKEDVVGLCHYRRYFATSRHLQRINLLKKKTLFRLLKSYDIILPQREEEIYNGMTAKEQFSTCHDVEVWDKCKNIIKITEFDYLKDFDWFEKQTTGFCYNMIISSKKIIDQYCAWLFPILFELEEQVDLSQYDNYNQRMFGFVSERLLNVWIHHQNFKIKELPVYFVDKPLTEKVSNKLHSIFNRDRGE